METNDFILLLMSPEEREIYTEAMVRAGTSGPILVNGKIVLISGVRMDEIFRVAKDKGGRPCYEDEETGYVHVGHFVFVPAPEES
jgi:hypothetical protein